MKEKSILEEALLQVENLEDALKQNAKGILSSVMKKELNDLLKESLEEEEETEVEVDEQPEAQVNPEEEEDDISDDEAEADDSENDTDLNKEPNKDIEGLDSEDGEEEDDDFSLPPAEEGSEDEDVMDMTGASDEEVLKVFKAMKPEDGIVVKKDGNKVELETGDDEFIIKLDEEEEESHESDFNQEWNEEEDENLYEIELDEEDDEMKEEEEEEVSEEEEEEMNEAALKGLGKPKKVEAKESALKGLGKPKKVEAKESALKGLGKPKKVEAKEEENKEEATEAARTKWNPHGGDRAGIKSKKLFKAGSKHGGSLNEEVETLRKQNQEYKKALILFKDKLNEVAVFNANLAYATRLFTEHSTTKQEKLNILKRFDTVSNISESKGLYNTIKTELGAKKPVTESVVNKITSTPSTSSSKEMLAESKVYEDQNFRRVKELMKKIK